MKTNPFELPQRDPRAPSLRATASQSTIAVHAGTQPDPTTGAILTPIYLSTTFVQPSVGEYLSKGYSYSRTGNPTVTAYENRIASLEGGLAALAFGTGMAATVAVISSFMKAGDHCVVTDCSYGGTNRLMRMYFAQLGMEFTFVDMRDIDNIKRACKDNTRVIFSESPANPLLTLNDIAAISRLAKTRGIVHVCDSTFATPIICRPLDLGADVVLQSTTKFYDGHDMTTGGALAFKNPEHYDKAAFVRNMLGSIMSPFTAFLQLQTCKTIELRVRRQSETALKIARWLEGQQKVEKVVYPGLSTFSQRELADRQHQNGLHGSMLWFEVAGGSAAGTKLMDMVGPPWSLCENLGATESIITACAVMTHANMLKEDRERLGITDGFIRCSVGIEDVDDLISSLERALSGL